MVNRLYPSQHLATPSERSERGYSGASMAQSKVKHKTAFPGVRYREHPTRKHGAVNKDRYYTISYKGLNLIYNILWLSRTLPATNIWNYAISTEIIAAKADIYTRLKRIFSRNWKIFYDLICILPNIDNHTLFIKKSCCEKLSKFIKIMSTKNKIYKLVITLKMLDN